jgi:hypothetical protein
VSSENKWSLESFIETIKKANKSRTKYKNGIAKTDDNELLIQLQKELIRICEDVLGEIKKLIKRESVFR